jgi:carboxyl-terminal processing protease
MSKLLLTLLSAAAGMALGFAVTRPDTAIVDARAATAVDYKQINRLGAAVDLIRTNYVDRLDLSDLVDAAIKGMVGLLDSPSNYFDEKTFREMTIQIVGELAGLGIEATMENGLVKVIAPIDESPAAKAGVIVNDIITHIDDVPLQGLTLDQAVEKTRGPVNTRARLTIMRKGHDKPVELTVVREVIRVRSVRTRKEGEDIGYIRISWFNEQTRSLGKAIDELSSQIPADELKGYILDLRNNAGGLFDVVVSVADEFLDDGEIVSVRGRNPEQVERFNARPGDIIHGKPLVVLINGGSASGAEIVAGALQDHKRATVIGSRSFGKGSVQTIVPLGPGNGALRLTTGRYLTPAGRSIHAAGILPDIEVLQDLPQSPEHDKVLNIARDLLRGITSNPAFPPSSKP